MISLFLLARLALHTGVFPSNFVADDDTVVGEEARAEYDYKPGKDKPDHLPFAKGDKLTILSKVCLSASAAAAYRCNAMCANAICVFFDFELACCVAQREAGASKHISQTQQQTAKKKKKKKKKKS